MNLIPFVIIIIVILGMFSYSSFSSSITKKKEATHYKAYFQGLREIRNLKAEQAYLSQLTSKERAELDTPKEFSYFRERWEGAPQGRINLYPLIENPASNKTLYSVALNYLELLYGTALFHENKDQGMCKKILDQLLKSQKKSFKETQGPLKLYEVAFEESHLKEKYFKMLSGTTSYNLREKQGYLPLKQAIEFEKSTSKPIKFPYANTLLIEALFGKKVTKEILNAELEIQQTEEKVSNTYALTENDLKEITWKNNVDDQVFLLLDYKKTKDSPPISWTDPNTNITIRLQSDYK
ncbi:MAG: hypothetical protein H6620_09845 [Halobacteriovoraceae bacterium]|nr:hypothetical protein [Halobacteriovoraceae bacterium]